MTTRRRYAKSAKALALAIENAGLLTDARKEAIYSFEDPPSDEVIKSAEDGPQDEVVAHFFDVLVALVREPNHERQLVRGQGNFGSAEDDEPPASPLYTECTLTDLGRALLADDSGAGGQQK